MTNTWSIVKSYTYDRDDFARDKAGNRMFFETRKEARKAIRHISGQARVVKLELSPSR